MPIALPNNFEEKVDGATFPLFITQIYLFLLFSVAFRAVLEPWPPRFFLLPPPSNSIPGTNLRRPSKQHAAFCLPVGFRKVLCFLKHAPVISEDVFKCIIFEFIKLCSYHSFVRFVNRKQTKECLVDCHLL